jgi:PIN domain nuclease of toxin-antitoxin system
VSISILDACAMIAYLQREPGGHVVAGKLIDPNVVCYAHAINILEVYYDTARKSNVADAEQAIARLEADGVLIRRDMDDAFLFSVGNLKAGGGISIPDCFCIVLAQALDGEVVTSDHHEFDKLVPLGLCPMLFIR